MRVITSPLLLFRKTSAKLKLLFFKNMYKFLNSIISSIISVPILNFWKRTQMIRRICILQMRKYFQQSIFHAVVCKFTFQRFLCPSDFVYNSFFGKRVFGAFLYLINLLYLKVCCSFFVIFVLNFSLYTSKFNLTVTVTGIIFLNQFIF